MKHLSIQKINLILLATFLVLITPILLKAQSKPAKKFVVIDLIVQDSSMLKNFYIQFEMYKNNLNTNFTLDRDYYKFKVNKKSTRIKIPLSTSVNYGQIKCFYDSQIRLQPFDEDGTSIYIFEKGDEIKLIITKTTIRFEGRRTEKYKCIQNVNSNPDFDRAKYHKLAAEKRYEEMFKFMESKYDSIFNKKREILYQYKSKLAPEVYNLILGDCQAYYNSKLLSILEVEMDSDEEKKKAILRTYDKWFKEINLPDLNETAIVSSFRFCDFLFDKAKFGISLLNQSDGHFKRNSYTFEALYNFIQKNPRGIIRDKLTLLAFYSAMTPKNGLAYLEPAYKTMGNNIFRTAISQLLKSYSSSIYSFKFQDQSGKLRTLSEFKNKLLVLDFWFTGCVGCSSLAKELKPIIQSYNDNKNIEFISISTDKQKEEWLNSVNKETYSDKNQVNLFTNGLGERHPIIQNYNIQSYPALFLISKDGQIITTAMPRPVKGKPETVLVFKNLIHKNL